MTDVSLLNSGTPSGKLFLNPVVNSLTCNSLIAASVDIQTIETKSLTLVQQSSVPNPAVGSQTLYVASGTGLLTTQDSSGDSVSYLPETGGTMTGPIDMGAQSITNASTINANTQMYVNNLGISFSNFQQAAQVTVTNTAALTSVTTGSGNIGSLTFPTSNQGQWMQIYAPFQTTSTATPTLTFNLMLNGTSASTIVLSPPNALMQGLITVLLMVGGDFLNVYMEELSSGVSNTASFARVTYVPASSNVFDLAVQWSAADSSNVCGVTSVQMITNGFTSATPPVPEFKETSIHMPQHEIKELKQISPKQNDWIQYSMFTPITISNTTKQSFLTLGDSVGQLVLPPLPKGTLVKIRGGFSLSCLLGSSIILRFGSSAPLIAQSFGGTSDQISQSGTLSINFIVAANSQGVLQMSSQLNDELPTIAGATSFYDHSISNNISLTGQWTAADKRNSFTLEYFTVEIKTP